MTRPTITVSLRPYQVSAISGLRAKIAAGVRLVVLVCPTGGGKTVIAAAMVESAVARGKRVVFIAHRKELIDQTVDKLGRFGVKAGVIMATDSRRDDYLPVQVCSIQTLSRRAGKLPSADLVIYDEVHHATSNSARAVLEAYPNAVVIGLTATPWRSDKKGLADVFGASVLAATMKELMGIGALVEYDAFAYDAPELHAVKMVAGDFSQKDLGLACNTDVLVGSVVREYVAHAMGRRGIVFPVNVAHSLHLVDEFRAAGVVAEHVDCNTKKAERERVLAGLASGAITVVASVGVLTEGFDCPAAEVCILARPTKSLGLYMQMIGRVLRPSPDTGKVKALIHDHSGNLLRHGFPEDDRDYALTATPARVRELHTCPMCYVVFGSIRPDGTCPHCHELIASPDSICKTCGKIKGDRDLDNPASLSFCKCESLGGGEREAKKQVDGVRLTARQIREMRERRQAGGITRDLTDRQLARVAEATTEEKAAEYKRLIAVRDARGLKEGFPARAYRDTFGVWPKFPAGYLDKVEPAARPFIPLPPRTRGEEAA
jgi:DNA repair protein RadD